MAQLQLSDLAARVNQNLGPARPIVVELGVRASEGVSQAIYDVDVEVVRRRPWANKQHGMPFFFAKLPFALSPSR